MASSECCLSAHLLSEYLLHLAPFGQFVYKLVETAHAPDGFVFYVLYTYAANGPCNQSTAVIPGWRLIEEGLVVDVTLQLLINQLTRVTREPGYYL